jgi:hypothetical protein
MTRDDRVVGAALVVALTVAGALELASVPGPWWSLAGLVGTGTLLVAGMRTRRRQEEERQAAFAERIRRIRAREIAPRDHPGGAGGV